MVQSLKEACRGKYIVGLTGGFGSGKSTVAKFLQEKGVFVLSADVIAHGVFQKDHKVGQKIAKAFPEAVTESGEFDLKKIAQIIFSNPLKKEVLENLIHPYVLQHFKEELPRRREDIVVLEVPLLFETGWDQMCHFTIAMSVEPSVAIERLKARGYSQSEAQERMNSQLSNSERERKADVVIQNNGTLKSLKNEVELIGEKIYSLSKGAK